MLTGFQSTVKGWSNTSKNIKNEFILIKKFIFCKNSLDKLIKICYNANNSDAQLFQKV